MLVNCVAYQDGKRLGDLSVAQISEYLVRADCFVWVGLKDAEPDELEAMRAQFNLHELAVEDARKGHQRPKIEEYGDSLFVVLHTVEFGPDGDLFLGEVNIFVGRNYVLSIRTLTQQGFAAVRERCEREPELLKWGPAYILYVLIDTVVDRYFPVIDDLAGELERIEDRIFSKNGSARRNIEEVYALKRKLMTLQHAVMPLLEAIGKLHGGRVPHLCQNLQEYFRDITDHLIRISKSVDGIREMTTTAIQVNLSLISLSESEVTKKLASYGALFAVPTAIAGIYGMNFDHMPELRWPFGYPLTVAVIVVADLLLFWRFRRAKWM